MRLLAISDLHISHAKNREALEQIGRYPDDWLIVAGDIGEKADHLRTALDILMPRFAKVIWTPGNHDLWCPPDAPDRTRGQARYDELVGICREYGAVTPEDPFVEWEPRTSHLAPRTFICPLFLLYDYTFHPAGVADPVAWAREHNIVCGDERMLSPEPWPSRTAWCHARVASTEQRLAALPADAETVLISHWPLRYDLARPPRIPRFSIWCGTTRTHDWPTRFRARVVVNGHLHMRTSLMRDGVRHEEVSLGYPRDWQNERGIDWYLRDVLAASETRRRFVPARDPFMMLPS
jgi:3',5'-cyclic AMP phosphodiesterase CpdA